jgi:rhodanese-related sulfurtransferase
MQKGLLIGCLLLLVLGAVAIAGPELTVENSDYDFGTIGLGYMAKHTFILQNTGDERMEIVYVRASCGCTTTELSTTSLAPGESVPLEVLVLADHGTTKNVTIYVHTNAPDQYGNVNDDRTDVDMKLYVRGLISPPKQDYEIAPFELAYDLQVIVDVRDEAAFAANHLMGAINAPANDVVAYVSDLPKGALIIVYDLAGEAADAAVQKLVTAGFMSAYYLQGGLSRWIEVQLNPYMVNETPLPSASGSVSGGSTGRPWSQGQLNSDFYVLIDLRDADAYAAGHLAGAMNIPPTQLSQWFERIPKAKRVIIYDDDETTSLAAYQSLIGAGFTRTHVLLGGLNEWIYQYGDAFIIQI